VKLSELLVESAVMHAPEAREKWQVIEGLTDLLLKTDQIASEHRDAVHDALVARERSMSTGMEHGVAIPHTSVEVVEHPAVSLGIFPDGLEFQSIDGRPTYLVILLVNPANRTKDHIRTLAEIARLLSNAELRQALVGSSDAAQALEIIRAAEAVAT
jgi:mannitol/fructose-specific phosphotransferase system IIA component (Ntr-type)